MSTTPTPSIERASVKVMRSYNYCHFEVVLSASFESTCNEPLEPSQVDALRKEAARLADKAVEQYKVAQAFLERRERDRWDRRRLGEEVERIREKPESEWTPEDKAAVKKYQDDGYWARRGHYDYEDDYTFDDDDSDDEEEFE